MEDVTPVPSPPRQAAPPVSQEQEASAQGQRSRGSSRVSRWGPQDQSLQQDTSRRASPPAAIPPAPMKTSEQDLERPPKIEAERPESEDRLEAVTPERDDDSELGREGAKDSLSKDTRSEDRKSTDYLTRDQQRKDSPVRSEIRKTRDSDNRRSRDSPSRLEDSRTRDVSPRVSRPQRGVSEPDPGNRPPTVDEFGRFIRPGGSESDAEDSQYDRRRSASRSRSRSPASRRRRRSRSRSPRRHGRWSRSRRFATCLKHFISS
jgi:U2-associated protein SR140